MEFEEILNDIGGYGRYQKLLIFCFVIPFYSVLPLFSMPIIFLTSIPDHWCYVPIIANSNLSIHFQKKLIQPPGDPKCSMYDVNYTEMARTGKWKIDTKARTKPCDKGWQFDKTRYDETATTKWNLVCKDDHFVPLLLTCAFLGVIIGTPLFLVLINNFGRKLTFLFSAALIALTDVGSTVCPVFTLVIILRIAEGMGLSAITTQAYIIILEVVSPDFHTRINGISTTAWSAGACLVPLLAWLTRHWVHFTAVNSSCAAFLLIYWKFIPESPGWLISQGHYEEVAKIFASINRINGGTPEDRNVILEKVQEIGEKYERKHHSEPKYSYMEIFKHKLLRKRFFLLTICWMCNSVPYFGLQMNTRNLPGNPFINFFLAFLVEVPTHFATWLLMTKGRRLCLLLALSLTVISCFLTLPLKDYDESYIVSTILAKAGTCSVYMTLYVFSLELFPTPLQSQSITMCCLMAAVAACFSSYAVLMAKYGGYITFLIFSALTAIGFVCVYFLPETVDKDLPRTISEAEIFEKDFGKCPCDCNPTVEESAAEMILTPVGYSDPPTEDDSSSERKKRIQRQFKNKTVPLLFQTENT